MLLMPCGIPISTMQIMLTTRPPVLKEPLPKSHMKYMSIIATAPMTWLIMYVHFLVSFLVKYGVSTLATKPPGTTNMVRRLYAASFARAYLQK